MDGFILRYAVDGSPPRLTLSSASKSVYSIFFVGRNPEACIWRQATPSPTCPEA
jgi:hypothetical protein